MARAAAAAAAAAALRVAGYARTGWGGAPAMEMEAFTGKLHAYLRSVSTRIEELCVALCCSCAAAAARPPSLSLLRRPVGRHTRMDKMDDRSTAIKLTQLFCSTHSRYS